MGAGVRRDRGGSFSREVILSHGERAHGGMESPTKTGAISETEQGLRYLDQTALRQAHNSFITVGF